MPRPRYLPVQLQRELELPWIIGGSGLSGVAGRTTAKRADRGHIVLVGDVEHVDDQVGVEALAKVDAFGDAQVVEESPGLDSGVAAQVTVELLQRGHDSGGN